MDASKVHSFHKVDSNYSKNKEDNESYYHQVKETRNRLEQSFN